MGYWTYDGPSPDGESDRDKGMAAASAREGAEVAEIYCALADEFLIHEIKIGDIFQPARMHERMREKGLRPQSEKAWGAISSAWLKGRMADGSIEMAGINKSGIRSHHAGLVRVYKRTA